jgi:hypothetical protein
MPNPKVIIQKIETEQEKYIVQIMEKAIFGTSKVINLMAINERLIEVIAITSYDEAIGIGFILFNENKETTLKVGVVKGFRNLGYEELIENNLRILAKSLDN